MLAKDAAADEDDDEDVRGRTHGSNRKAYPHPPKPTAAWP